MAPTKGSKRNSRKARPHPASFRFSPKTIATLDKITSRWGWSKVVAVERAIAFAEASKGFTPTATQEVAS